MYHTRCPPPAVPRWRRVRPQAAAASFAPAGRVFRWAGRIEFNGLIASVGLILGLQGAALPAFGRGRIGSTRRCRACSPSVSSWFPGSGWRRAARDREDTTAAALGINVVRIRQAGCVIGAAFAGPAGRLPAWLFPTTPVLGVQPVLTGFVVISSAGRVAFPAR